MLNIIEGFKYGKCDIMNYEENKNELGEPNEME